MREEPDDKRGGVGHEVRRQIYHVTKLVDAHMKQTINTTVCIHHTLKCALGASETPAASVAPAFTSGSAEDVAIIKAAGPLVLSNQREPGAPVFNQSNS